MKNMIDNNNALESISNLKKAFEVFDKNKDGNISISDLKELVKLLGQEISDVQLQSIIHEVDSDGKEKIDFKEFLGLMSRKMRDPDTDEELIEVFKVFDSEGDGTISKKEMKLIVGDNLSEEEIEEIFKEGAIGEERINYEDFVRMIINK
jgi:calmodulin